MEKTTQKTIKKYKDSTLSISIDGKWSTIDFTTCFKSIEYLYIYYVSLSELKEHLKNEETLKHAFSTQKASSKLADLWFTSNIDLCEYEALDPFRDKRSSFIHSFPYSLNLELKKIQYASPGSIDFLGIGEIFKTVKEIIFNYVPNKETKLKNESLKLNNLEKEIQILEKLGYNNIQIKSIILKKEIAQNHLLKLSESKKIKNMKIS